MNITTPFKKKIKNGETKEEKRERKKRKIKQQEARKKVKRRKKLQKKYKKDNIRDKNDAFSPLFGYDYRPSYINVGNRVATILKIVNKYGTNHEASFGWFVNLIPESSEEGRCKTYLVEADKPIDTKKQDEIFKKNINKVIRGHSEENDSNADNEGDRTIKQMVVDDLLEASRKEAKSTLAMDSFIYLIVTGDTPYHVSKLLRKINENYKDRINGVQAMSVAGNQEKMFTTVLEPPKGDKHDYTWMSSDFSGNDHAVRRGLDDDEGVSVGGLTEDYTGGQALMSLYDSIGKKALIAGYESSSVFEYDMYPELTGASMWGQRIANDAMTKGHRVFHIVMNDFEYGADDFDIEGEDNETKFICPVSLEYDIGRVDLSKGNLNPMEMFGDKERDKENVSQIFNSNVSKLRHMFNLMSGRTIKDRQKTMLEEAIIAFYVSKNMWHKQAEKYPNALRLFGLKSESVPKMGALTTQLTQLILENSKNKEYKLEDDIRDARHLQSVMKTALARYRSIVNTTTTLQQPKSIDKLQMYYNLNKLNHDPAMLEAQFLNIFSYVMTACEPGDVIMFHGLDRISIETLNILKSRMNTATRQGIKMVYLFDTIGGGEYKSDVEYANVFNTEGILYQSLDVDFGYTIFGAMNLKDLELYQQKVKQKLTGRLKSILTATNQPFQYQIRRPSDLTTVMVQAHFFI
ncbi:TPA: hypothetical protein PET91_002567 [Staphylococcus aureus]|uniref:hypothetical protein n=1 Tax=Staphylococcus aureus TaxID=1280 RepID=UPI0028B38CF5|nr:hypothetical protein [Staphylococcus aureus]HDB3374725.1 hypothetical protein [Staphylococcus aureus]HDC8354706.1 hypothetical protein [Staphylococcus aureus]HDE3815414.1 hypothetical protein [Staphylococcus aureus]HDE9869379.1 hypothetical protein [Staphylococcus aureus]